MTKTQFYEAYEKELIDRWSWAQDTDKRNRFMGSVRQTMENGATTWNKNGPTTAAAWKTVGGKGIPTYKTLRNLPQ